MSELTGYLYDNTGTAISSATVQLLTKNSSTQIASTTTNSDGKWAFSGQAAAAYDVKITYGSSIRYIKGDQEVQGTMGEFIGGESASTYPLRVENSTNSASNAVLELRGNNSTRADNDEIYVSFKLDNDAGEETEFARITAEANDVSNGSEDGEIRFSVMKSGTLTEVWNINSSTSGATTMDMGVDSFTIGTGADTDVTLTFDANSADGVITWMEDEDYFQYSDDILMSSTEKILFGDAGTFIHQSSDGVLTIESDTTVDINGAVALNGAVTGATDITLSGELDAATLDISGNADIDGIANLDNTDIDGTLVVDGSNISLDSTTTLNIDNSNTSNGITIGTATSGVPVSIGHTTSETTINDNLTVTGDFTVNGTTTTVNSTTTTVDDPIFTLGGDTAPGSDDNKDRGIEFRYHDGSSARIGFFGFDDSTGKFTPLSAASNSSEVFSGTAMPAIFGNVEGVDGTFTGNLDIDGTANLDAVDIDGAVQLDSTLTIGADDQGYDVILYGDTASANMTWETSADDLIFNGAAGLIVPEGQFTLGSTAVSSTAAELNLLDGVSGLVQADFTKLAAVDSTSGELNLLDGSAKSTSSITIADTDAFVIIDGTTTKQIPASDIKTYASATASVATTVTITDNESTDEDNAIIFTAGGDVDGGNLGLESDGTLTYNPSTGKITATGFIGALTGDVTGNVTGNTSGTAATVTSGTQANITTLANLTTSGALGAGSITSGFGNIDIGSSTFDTTGAVSTGNLSPAGDVAIADAKVIKLGGARPADDEPATNNTGYGIVVLFDAGAAVAIGDAVSVDSNGRVIKTVADATGTLSGPCIGIATTAAGSADDDVYVMTHGIFRHDDWGLTAGSPAYIEEADPGDLSATAPNDDGDYVQRVGVAVKDDVLLVMPSIDVIEHTGA